MILKLKPVIADYTVWVLFIVEDRTVIYNCLIQNHSNYLDSYLIGYHTPSPYFITTSPKSRGKHEIDIQLYIYVSIIRPRHSFLLFKRLTEMVKIELLLCGNWMI